MKNMVLFSLDAVMLSIDEIRRVVMSSLLR